MFQACRRKDPVAPGDTRAGHVARPALAGQQGQIGLIVDNLAFCDRAEPAGFGRPVSVHHARPRRRCMARGVLDHIAAPAGCRTQMPTQMQRRRPVFAGTPVKLQ
jgi:hypothetical protein